MVHGRSHSTAHHFLFKTISTKNSREGFAPKSYALWSKHKRRNVFISPNLPAHIQSKKSFTVCLGILFCTEGHPSSTKPTLYTLRHPCIMVQRCVRGALQPDCAPGAFLLIPVTQCSNFEFYVALCDKVVNLALQVTKFKSNLNTVTVTKASSRTSFYCYLQMCTGQQKLSWYSIYNKASICCQTAYGNCLIISKIMKHQTLDSLETNG